MKKNTRKNLQVEAIRDGTVIDHIPIGQGIHILKHLHLLNDHVKITVGFNLPSQAMQLKDIIKIESLLFNREKVNRLAIFAPHATVSTIENYEVKAKEKMKLPNQIKGVFQCPNSNCITHQEPIASLFQLSEENHKTRLQCLYCEKIFLKEIVTS